MSDKVMTVVIAIFLLLVLFIAIGGAFDCHARGGVLIRTVGGVVCGKVTPVK